MEFEHYLANGQFLRDLEANQLPSADVVQRRSSAPTPGPPSASTAALGSAAHLIDTGRR